MIYNFTLQRQLFSWYKYLISGNDCNKYDFFPFSISCMTCFTSSVLQIWLNIVLVQLIAWVISYTLEQKAYYQRFEVFSTSRIAVGLEACLVSRTHRGRIGNQLPQKCPFSNTLIPAAALVPEYKASVSSGPWMSLWALPSFFPGGFLDSLSWGISSIIFIYHYRKTIGWGGFSQTVEGQVIPCSLVSQGWLLAIHLHDWEGYLVDSYKEDHFQSHPAPALEISELQLLVSKIIFNIYLTGITWKNSWTKQLLVGVVMLLLGTEGWNCLIRTHS